jgi:hypothetical protein
LEASSFQNGNFTESERTAVSSEDEAEAADDADEEAGLSDGRHRLTKDQVPTVSG